MKLVARSRWTAGLLVSLSLGLGGCPWGGGEPRLGPAITGKNATDEVLTFRVLGETGWLDLPAMLRPGQDDIVMDGGFLAEPTVVAVDGCTDGDLVALAPDGREVARHAPPLCGGDHWIITEEMGE